MQLSALAYVNYCLYYLLIVPANWSVLFPASLVIVLKLAHAKKEMQKKKHQDVSISIRTNHN